jgi:hypothetical protein
VWRLSNETHSKPYKLFFAVPATQLCPHSIYCAVGLVLQEVCFVYSYRNDVHPNFCWLRIFMNSAQRKVVRVLCWILAPILFLAGLVQENFIIAIVLPILLIGYSFFIKKGADTLVVVSPKLTESYVDLMKDDFIRSYARGFASEVKDEIDSASVEEIEKFIIDNTDANKVKQNLMSALNLLYTQKEIAGLAEFGLSPLGRKSAKVSYEMNNMLKESFKGDAERLAELLMKKYDLE